MHIVIAILQSLEAAIAASCRASFVLVNIHRKLARRLGLSGGFCVKSVSNNGPAILWDDRAMTHRD